MNAAARGTAVRLLGHLRDELGRTNFAGRPVTLLEGVGAAAGVVALAAPRGRRTDAMVLGAVAALGLVDDLVEERRRARGIPVAKGRADTSAASPTAP